MRLHPRYKWFAAAALLLLSCAGLTLLSSRFVFGQGHAERPIVAVTLIYLLGWTGFAVASWVAVRHKRGPVGFVLTVAVAARLILLPSNLIQENDCYRYVLDGESIVHGVNPFANAPAQAGTGAPRAFREALARDDAKLIQSRITYTDIRTIYPPAAQAAFGLGALITPWNWMGQRIVFLAGDLATLAGLILLLYRLKKPAVWVVFYAWNPLVLKEVVNSVHVDGLAALWVVVMLVCLDRWTLQERSGWAAVAGGALALAVLTKLYPLVLAPACLALLLRGRHGLFPALVFLTSLSALIVSAYLPFLNVGWADLTEGLRAYAEGWRKNDGAFALLAWVFPRPRLVAGGMVIAVGLLVAGRFYRQAGDFNAFLWAVQVTLLAWFLVVPAPYPWYTVALLATSALRPRLWAVVLSGAFGLYYLHFWIDYHDLGAGWHTFVEAVEHGSVWLAVIAPYAAARIGPRKPVPNTGAFPLT